MQTKPEQIFEIHGYYEELVTPHGDGFRSVGNRTIPHPGDRPLGVDGVRDYVFTAPLEVQRGHKTVAIAASVARPLRCRGYAQAICGRPLNPTSFPARDKVA